MSVDVTTMVTAITGYSCVSQVTKLKSNVLIEQMYVFFSEIIIK